MSRVKFNTKVKFYEGIGDELVVTEGDLCGEDKKDSKIYGLGGRTISEEEDLEEEEAVVIEDIDSIFEYDAGGKPSADEYEEDEEEEPDSPVFNAEKRCLEVFLRQLKYRSDSMQQVNSSDTLAQDISFESEATTNPDESIGEIIFIGASASANIPS